MDAARPFDFSADPVTLLVVGTAPGVREDIAAASTLRPNCKVMAINDAAALFPAAFLFSYHAEQMALWAQAQRNIQADFTTHADAAKFIKGRTFPDVDYVWPDLHAGATSAISGAHVGLRMGFQEVILCGCPLNGGDGYVDGAGGRHSPANPRVGCAAPENSLIRNFQESARRFAAQHAGRVFSMSGFTRTLFGFPPEAPRYGYH